jgi:2'-5' RNA ligase
MTTPRAEGERLLIAATIDSVEEGQAFETLPPHMTIVRWFSLAEHRRHFLDEALGRIMTIGEPFQDLIGGKHSMFGEHQDVPVREMLGAEIGPHFALSRLARGYGKYEDDDSFTETFRPHITDTPEYAVRAKERVSMATVALFSARRDERLKTVEAAYQLGKQRG